MRLITISLIISLIGIFILFVLSFFIAPAEVSSASQLQLNNYVSAQGTIKQIKTYDDFSVIKLDNNITITCSCNFSINKSIALIPSLTV